MNDKEIIALLQRQLEVSDRMVASLTADKNDLSAKVDELLVTIKNLNKTIKSLEKALLAKGVEADKIQKTLNSVKALLPKTSEKQTPSEAEEPDPDFIPHAPKEKYDPKKRGNNGAKRNPHAELEEVIIEVEPDDPTLDKDIADELPFRDVVRFVVTGVRYRKVIYRLKTYTHNGTIYQGKAPAAPLLNSSYDGSFIAWAADLHYMHSMPVARIARYAAEQGFDISRATLSGLLSKTSFVFDKLHEAIKTAVKAETYIGCDETYSLIRVDEENSKGQKKKKGYLWVTIGHTTGLVYFFYSEGSRKEEVFADFIKGYRGTVQSDGFGVYRKLGETGYEGITRIPCLQHIKRKFVELKDNPKANKILKLLNLFYNREHQHRIGKDGWTEEDNLKWRREYAPPIIEKLKTELKKLKEDPDVPPKCALAEAVTFADNEMKWLPGIFESGKYLLDNNNLERINRCISLYRRNSMFFGSHKGAERASVYFSIAMSCRLNGINMFDYVTDMLNRCAAMPPTTPIEKYRDLLPDRWRETVAAEKA